MRIQPISFSSINRNFARSNSQKNVSFGMDIYGSSDTPEEELRHLRNRYKKETSNSYDRPSFSDWLGGSDGYSSSHEARGIQGTRGSKLEKMIRDRESRRDQSGY